MAEQSSDEKIRKESLEYHESHPKGKVEVVPTKPHGNAKELSLAYSPGVAYPCLEIEKNPNDAYRYTAKGNLVAVISNGTAVLGLGDIGALASKPVMEGKGLLFKTFADINVFDIEVDAADPNEFVKTVCAIAPTFGGINLEDIKAPECFEIERLIAENTDIPVMHDDQHGTAIITGAALLNAVELQSKHLGSIKVVVVGAGASALACANHYVALGVRRENITMCDSKGIMTISRLNRGELNEYKAAYAQDRLEGDLATALVGADVLLGLSKGGIVSKEMVSSMAKKPIIFALANPTPEIMPGEAKLACPDAIIATGRSDFPNQVNNVLGFPYIFRGALDVRARDITPGMKMAATKALAALAKEPVPDTVSRAYSGEAMHYGRDYIIPKPFDERVLIWEASAVAQAAVDEGIAMVKPEDFDIESYMETLEARQGLSYSVMRSVFNQVKGSNRRVVFLEGDDERVIQAAAELVHQQICHPILLGNPPTIRRQMEEIGVDFECDIVNPRNDKRRKGKYSKAMFEKRQRKGVTRIEAQRLLKSRVYFAAQMVASGDADALVGGLSRNYADVLKPCIQLIGKDEDAHCLVGCYMVTVKGRVFFLADATVNVYPDSKTLAEITLQTAKVARYFGVEPKVAMLSFSDFGSSRSQRSDRIEDAIEIIRDRDPSIIIDGPMQADTALNENKQKTEFSFMELNGPANILICPNLASANIAYKLLQELGDAEMTGPILSGIDKSVQLLARSDNERDITHMTAIAVRGALRKESFWQSLEREALSEEE